MVDQVCMSESNRRGFLCFCNDPLCNTSAIPTTKNASIVIGLASLILVIFANGNAAVAGHIMTIFTTLFVIALLPMCRVLKAVLKI